jgi:hypothetical protein
MNRFDVVQMLGGGMVATAFFAVFALFSCFTGKPAVDVSQYEAESLACIDTAQSRAEADACKARVKGKWYTLWQYDAGGE